MPECQDQHRRAAMGWLKMVQAMESLASRTAILIPDSRRISRRSVPFVVGDFVDLQG